MDSEENIITYGDIELVWPYEINSLCDLKIINKLNNHAMLHITGVLSESRKDIYVEKASADDMISVYIKGSKERTLFCGYLSNINVKCVRGVYYLEVEAQSHTCEMDVLLKSRSFQDKGMTYEKLFKEVIKGYPGADFKDFVSSGHKIDEFTVQYNETDWQFLKRMASRLGAVLVPQTDADKPKFTFGISEEKEIHLSKTLNYSIKKDLAYFNNLSGNNVDGIDDNDFTYCVVNSYEFIDLGWKVKFKDMNLVCIQSIIEMDNGILGNTYILAPKNAAKLERIENKSIIGASIEGKVIDIEKDNIKVHLGIDKAQSKSEACWFQYTTNYTAEGNSGWYCMPKLGDYVNLYFQCSTENNAVVRGSSRKGGGTQKKTSKPSLKYLETDFGKVMKLGETDVSFAAKEGAMVVNLDEGSGISIQSNKALNASATKKFTIKSEKSIKISAGESIYFSCAQSNILMDGEVDIKGSSVQIEGYIKPPLSLSDLIDIAKDAVMVSVEMALAPVSMVASVGSAVASGDIGGAAMAAVSCVPVVGTAIYVADATSSIAGNGA